MDQKVETVPQVREVEGVQEVPLVNRVNQDPLEQEGHKERRELRYRVPFCSTGYPFTAMSHCFHYALYTKSFLLAFKFSFTHLQVQPLCPHITLQGITSFAA